ncbi:MAG: class B sortase [Acetatifactor sp.]|nr:class B sortase [Acetatifactor sp.]
MSGKTYYESMRNRQEQENLRKLVEAAKPEEITGQAGNSVAEGTEASESPMESYPVKGDAETPSTSEKLPEQEASVQEESIENPPILAQYEALYQANDDLVGWLSIEGMVIDYPVMRSEDDEFYLHHNFQGEEDKYGCLYVRSRADVDTPGTNFIIYGHNMKDGSMFGDLDLYRKKSFYQEHGIIRFDTLYEERSYEIVAVFLSQVYAEQDEVFKYYQFYEAETEEDFQYFYENIKELALYDTGVTAEYGDTFLTLSTCAYHVTDGRLVVVAKRI